MRTALCHHRSLIQEGGRSVTRLCVQLNYHVIKQQAARARHRPSAQPILIIPHHRAHRAPTASTGRREQSQLLYQLGPPHCSGSGYPLQLLSSISGVSSNHKDQVLIDTHSRNVCTFVCKFGLRCMAIDRVHAA